MEAKKLKLITHNGAFQPDDVFAMATLQLLCGNNVEIIRSRDMKVIETGDYVVDVGGEYDPLRNRFDHHQLGGAGVRENAIPYSAFGLVWKHFGVAVSGSPEVAKHLEETLVQVIDADDNGIEMYKGDSVPTPYGVENVIYAFVPTWAEKDADIDESFLKAVDIAGRFLVREIKQTTDRLKAKQFVEKAYEQAQDKRVIVLDLEYPTNAVLTQYPEPLYTVKPDRQNPAWMIKAVEVSAESFKSRKLFPESWAGKRDLEFEALTGVPGAFFCHKDRWIAGARTKEGAISLAKLAVEA